MVPKKISSILWKHAIPLMLCLCIQNGFWKIKWLNSINSYLKMASNWLDYYIKRHIYGHRWLKFCYFAIIAVQNSY
jgi:hypothetical protein